MEVMQSEQLNIFCSLYTNNSTSLNNDDHDKCLTFKTTTKKHPQPTNSVQLQADLHENIFTQTSLGRITAGAFPVELGVRR